MEYDIQMHLPSPWIVEQDIIPDESGVEVNHIQATLDSGEADVAQGLIDVYVGDMPDGETAEDQAFANYAEVVGFSEDDPEEFNPISKFEFNGKNAWGFYAVCEDESPMLCISQEVKKGILAIICIAAPSNEKLEEIRNLVERNFRVRILK